MKYILCFFLLSSGLVFSQTHNVLIIGNYEPVCFESDSSILYHYSDLVPDSLNYFDVLLIFSGTVSRLKPSDIDSIINFAASGNGVYCGAENQPFQQEFNQLSNRLFAQEAWGNFTNNDATLTEKSMIYKSDSHIIYAGETTVAVPFNSRVKVEAWLDDQPIITSYKIGEGKFVFDGGYSRFYCEQFETNKLIFNSIVSFLLTK